MSIKEEPVTIRATHSPMRTASVTFNCLPHDIRVKVLKYLPHQEMVRFERVSSEWAADLDILYKKQKKISICYSPRFELESCSHLQHQLATTNIFIDSGSYYTHMKRSCYHFMRRCPNLTVLRFNATFIVSPTFGSDLAHFCPLLEHVSFSDANTFRAFCSYAPALEGRCRLKCVLVTETDIRHTLEGFSDDVAAFVQYCPRLEYFHNMTYSNTKKTLSTVIPKVKHFHATSFPCNDEDLKEVMETASCLESFSCNDVIPKSILRTLVAIPSLVSIGLPASSDLNYLNMFPKTWKELSFWSDDLDRGVGSWTIIERLLTAVAGSLTGLHLRGFDLTEQSIVNISNRVPHLTSLTLGLHSETTLTAASCNAICALVSLERLSLANIVITDQQFGQIMSSLVNLRELSLINFDWTHEKRHEVVAAARRNKNRILYVFLDHRLLPTVNQATEGLNTDEMYDVILVKENFRFIFCH